MKTALVAFNAKYIHKNLALRWIYVSKPKEEDAEIFEFTINDKIENTLQKVLKLKVDMVQGNYLASVIESDKLVPFLKEEVMKVLNKK